MEASHSHFFQTGFQLGNVSGFIRVGLEQSISKIRELASSAGSLANKRDVVLLERPEGLRFSPVLANKRLSLQAGEGSSGHSVNMPVLAKPAMVSPPPPVSIRHPIHHSTGVGLGIIPDGRTTPTTRVELNRPNRVEIIRSNLASKGFPPEVVELLMAGSRASTQTAYQSAWVSWCDWCSGHNIDPMSGALNTILKFLTDMFRSGKAYGTLNIFRSMLSSTLPPVDSFPVGQHPMVIRLLKGIYNSKPPTPRYSVTWDVDQVLRYFDTLEPNPDLPLKVISKKLALLLAITLMLRVSEIATISKQSVCITEEKVTFSLLKPRKAQKTGAPHSFSIKKFRANPKLCPVSCFGYYVFLTDTMRSDLNSDSLFMALLKPHRPVTGATIGRWIKEMMSLSGIDTSVFKAHSTRGAAASRAAGAGVPIDSILSAAHWAQESTFKKFYCREVQLPSISNIILESLQSG